MTPHVFPSYSRFQTIEISVLDRKNPEYTVAPLREILIYTVYGSDFVSKLWATLITDYRDSVPYYTVVDHSGQISVITTNLSIARRYLDLCARGLSSQQILQLDHYISKAPLRKKVR